MPEGFFHNVRSITRNLTNIFRLKPAGGLVFGVPPSKPPLLSDWLANNPNISGAIAWEQPGTRTGPSIPTQYVNWSSKQKADLQAALMLAWDDGPFTNVIDPAPNEIQPPLNDHPMTILKEDVAWNLYVSRLAQSLKNEIGKMVPWSLNDYSFDLRLYMLDSRSLFAWHHPVFVPDDASPKGDKLIGDYWVNAWTLPAHGSLIMAFVDQQKIVGATRLETITNLLNWCGKNTFHYTGSPDVQNMINVWQYRGYPPVSRVIAGTIDTKDFEPAESKLDLRLCWRRRLP